MFFKNALKGRQEWYLYLITIVLIAFGYVLGQLPMTFALFIQMSKYPDIGADALVDFQSNPDFTLFHIDQNFGFFLLLFIFVTATLGLYIGVKWLHKRSFRSLISWSENIDWQRIFWGFGIWMGMSLIAEGIYYMIDPSNYSFQTPGLSYLLLLFISLTILPIQTSFEEFLFRGYLMQGIGAALKNKWIALIVTSALFTLVHGMNPEIEKYGLLNMLPYYIIAGVFLGYITIMDNRLELALGIHAATNMFGALFVNYEGAALQTGSLFRTATVEPILLSFVFLVLAIIFVLLAAKRFHWKSPIEVFKYQEKEEIV